MRVQRGALRDERGSSLIEIMLSATLIGIAFMAIFGALSAGAISAQKNNVGVQVEVALSTAKQSLAQASFDATGTYGTIFPATINGVSVTLNPSPAVAAPGYTLGELQAVTIEASLAGTTKTITVYKGNR